MLTYDCMTEDIFIRDFIVNNILLYAICYACSEFLNITIMEKNNKYGDSHKKDGTKNEQMNHKTGKTQNHSGSCSTKSDSSCNTSKTSEKKAKTPHV